MAAAVGTAVMSVASAASSSSQRMLPRRKSFARLSASCLLFCAFLDLPAWRRGFGFSHLGGAAGWRGWLLPRTSREGCSLGSGARGDVSLRASEVLGPPVKAFRAQKWNTQPPGPLALRKTEGVSPFKVKVAFPVPPNQQKRNHPVDGSQRYPGPIRRLEMIEDVQNTLELTQSETWGGVLWGRYKDEIAQHLKEKKAMMSSEHFAGATVYWDYETMDLNPETVRLVEQVNSRLQWIAGLTAVPITKVEAFEYTPFGYTTDETLHNTAFIRPMEMLRKCGGIVHRVWPKVEDRGQEVLMERMLTSMKDIVEGRAGPRILVVISNSDLFTQTIEDAQRMGITCILMDRMNFLQYFPGGRDFSVPMTYFSWEILPKEFLEEVNEGFAPTEGPFAIDIMNLEAQIEKVIEGPVRLVQGDEKRWELDRRRFHHWEDKMPIVPQRHDGTWVRDGIRLNDTLAFSLQRALRRTGAMGTRTGELKPEVRKAVERDLADLALGKGTNSAAFFWNYEDAKLLPAGPKQSEMLGRIIRWVEGVVGMPVDRAEMGANVEPWDKNFAGPQNWLREANKLGMTIHRVWPPADESINLALTKSVAVLAKAAALGVEKLSDGTKLPRLVVVVSKDLYFDQAMKDAQHAGVSALWFGTKERGTYYPANSDQQVRLDLAELDGAFQDLAECNVNPFLPGAHTPDHPQPWFTKKFKVPTNMIWGKPDELNFQKASVRQVLATAMLKVNDQDTSPKSSMYDD